MLRYAIHRIARNDRLSNRWIVASDLLAVTPAIPYSNSMSKLRSVLIISVLILLIVAGYFWWYRPSAVVRRAIGQLEQTKSTGFQVNIVLADTSAETAGGGIEVTLDGVYDGTSQGKDSIASDVLLSTRADGVSVNTEGEARLIGDQLFFLIRQVPSSFPVLDTLRGQWVKLPRGGEAEERSPEPRVLSFSGTKRIGKTEVNGTNATQYQAMASPDTAVYLMDSLARVLGTGLSDQQADELRTSLMQTSEVPLTVAVTPWGSEIKQIGTSLSAQGGSMMQFVLTLQDRNKPVSIVEPENAVTLEQLSQSQDQEPVPEQAPQ